MTMYCGSQESEIIESEPCRALGGLGESFLSRAEIPKKGDFDEECWGSSRGVHPWHLDAIPAHHQRLNSQGWLLRLPKASLRLPQYFETC